MATYSDDGKAVISALQALEVTGIRGDVEFSQEDGGWRHQRKGVPTFIWRRYSGAQGKRLSRIATPPLHNGQGST